MAIPRDRRATLDTKTTRNEQWLPTKSRSCAPWGMNGFRCSAMIEAAESHTGWLSTIPLQ